MTARDWVSNRLGEASTYIGGVLVASASLNLSGVSQNAALQSGLDLFSKLAPVVGAAMIAMSTRHA